MQAPSAATCSAECRLLFRSADPGAPPEEIRALAGAVRDWARVAVIADREMATAGLAEALVRAGHDVVPPAVVAHLRAEALMTAFRMQRLAARLRETVGALHAAGVPVLLLKGAAVGALLDPTLRSRPMADLDLLVPESALGTAEAAIARTGWQRSTDPVLSSLLQDAHHRPPFFDPEVRGLRLELHTRMLPAEHSFVFEEDDLWRDALDAPAPLEGARVPSIEHQLLHASTHFAWSHTMRFGAWRTFRSLHLLQRAGVVDWERAAAFSRTSRAGTCCYWTFRLARTLAGMPVPESVLRRLSPPNPASVQDALERHFIAGLAPGEGPECPSVRLENLLWRLALRPRWSGHARAGRWDPTNRWGRAMGIVSDETAGDKVRRHLRGLGRWWAFAARTLARRDADQAR